MGCGKQALDVMRSKGFNGRRIEPVVGHECIDLIDRSNLKIGDHTPLAMVCNDDHLSDGALDHLPDNFCFRIGRHGAAMLQADPIHADDGFIGKDLLEVIDGITPRNRVGARLVFPADQVIEKAGFAPFERGVHIIRTYGDTCIFADTGEHLGHCRAAVDKDNIALLDERRGQLTDAQLLLLEVNCSFL